MWGVNCKINARHLEHIEFEIFAGEDESFIVNRLLREKRCGTVEKIDEHKLMFSADVFDATEMIPWIRTFICRITRLECSNKKVENIFKSDLDKMYELYEIDGGEKDAV